MSVIFNTEGPIVSVTGTTASPTALQVSSSTGIQCPAALIQNTNATNDAVIGWGKTTNEAVVNATTNSPNQFYLRAGQDAVVFPTPDGYFAAVTTTNTVTIKVQPGTV